MRRTSRCSRSTAPRSSPTASLTRSPAPYRSSTSARSRSARGVVPGGGLDESLGLGRGERAGQRAARGAAARARRRGSRCGRRAARGGGRTSGRRPCGARSSRARGLGAQLGDPQLESSVVAVAGGRPSHAARPADRGGRPRPCAVRGGRRGARESPPAQGRACARPWAWVRFVGGGSCRGR